MSALLKFESQIRWQTCISCGVGFGVESSYDARLQESHQTFYCPNGHSQSYIGKTEAQRVREEMQAKIDEANRLTEWQRVQRIIAEKEAAKAKAKLKAQTKRVEAGVCIHCNRTFKQLAAHMKCKHGGE